MKETQTTKPFRHTLLPESNLRRHDGRRSVTTVDTPVAEFNCNVPTVTLAGSLALPVLPPILWFCSLWFVRLFSSEYLLASLRSLSANDNELALSKSSSDRLCTFNLLSVAGSKSLEADELVVFFSFSVFLSSSVADIGTSVSMADKAKRTMGDSEIDGFEWSSTLDLL